MGDVESLLLVLGAVYLTECAAWIRRGGVGFRRLWTRDWKLWHPIGVLGNAHGAILVGNPLPPLEPILISYQFPLSVSTEAVYSYTAASLNPGWRAPQPARFVPLDEIRSVNVIQKKLLVNESFFLKATSVPAALGWKSLIQSLRERPLAKREAIIREFIDERFDVKRVEDRLNLLRKHSRLLRVLSHLLFFFLFGIAFPIAAIFGLSSTWMPLLGILLAHTVTISILFFRAHRALYPTAEEERFTRFLTMLLAPPTAIRAADLLGRNLLEFFHPLAVTKVLCSPDQFKQFGQEVLRDLHYPFGPETRESDPTLPGRTEVFFRNAVIATVERFLDSAGVDRRKLLAPPAKSDPVHRSFCPRCGAQFVNTEGHCHDCGGLPLHPFSASDNKSPH